MPVRILLALTIAAVLVGFVHAQPQDDAQKVVERLIRKFDPVKLREAIAIFAEKITESLEAYPSQFIVLPPIQLQSDQSK